MMVPSLDLQQARPPLSVSPVHVRAERLRHHRAAVVENARHAHQAPAGISAAAAPLAAVQGLQVVPSPQISGQLDATAAISANDIWAVGAGNFSTISGTATLIEHRDGTSWTIVSSPDPGTATDALFAVAALGDGTVVVVGTQEDSNTGVPTPLILQD
jgi:hypothetical protein